MYRNKYFPLEVRERAKLLVFELAFDLSINHQKLTA